MLANGNAHEAPRHIERRSAAKRSDLTPAALATVVRTFALACLIGLAGSVAGNLAATLIVKGYDPISETISRLAAGNDGWIQDLAFVSFAVGVLCCAVAVIMARCAYWKCAFGAFLLMLIAVDVGVIVVYPYNQPGSASSTIHVEAVWVLGFLVSGATWALSHVLQGVSSRWRPGSVTVCLTWIVLAPLLVLVPRAWDGAYERALALVFLGWIAVLSWILRDRAEQLVAKPTRPRRPTRQPPAKRR